MILLIFTLLTITFLLVKNPIGNFTDNILKAIYRTLQKHSILRGGGVIALIAIHGMYNFVNAQTCTVSISGSSTYCAGSSTTLTANATGSTGYTYLWSTGATTQSINVSNQGTYTVTVTGVNTGGGTNIVPNSDFSAGNSGFSSDYTFNASSNAVKNYTVTNNSQAWNYLLLTNYSNCQDHTSSSDNMKLLARGSNNSSNRVWYVVLPVTQNTVYDLSAWASSVSSSLISSDYAQLQFEVNGTLLGSSRRLTGACNWNNITTTWSSGSSTLATIAIKDINTSSDNDNNFILDDISMIPRTTPGCVISASKNITTTPLSTAEAGIDLNQCNNATFTMAANLPVSGTGVWSVVSGTAAITSVNAPNTVVTITGASATLRWTVTNGSCTSTDDIILNNATGAAGLFCNCGPIFGTSYGGTNVNYSDQIRQLNAANGIYGAQLGTTLTSTSAAIALDNRYQRMYYISNSGSNTTIYYMNNSGAITNTTVSLPGSVNYNRAGFNPIDQNIYFVNSDGTYWMRYTPTAAGTGGTTKQYTTVTYSPTSAPVINSSNMGGDIVFDAEGNGYLVTNPGHFYKVIYNSTANSVSLTYLGQLNLSMTQVAALAFSSDGKLFAGGNGSNIYYINLQTLEETQVNGATTSGTGDFSSCNFPVIKPELNAFKSFKKISGSSGTNIQTNDIVEYTINIQNIGDISAGNAKFQDNIPAGTSYVTGSTLLNGTAVSDVSGAMPFSITGGGFINSFDQAAQSGAVSPVPYSVTIKFKVRVTSTGSVVRNTGTITFGDNNEKVITNPVEFDVCYPITGITMGATPFCSGTTTTLTANEEGDTYLWNTGATTRAISITTGGTYTVTVTQAADGGGSNIVVNGDFVAGNTGFSTDYTNGTGGNGIYNVTNQANTFFSFALPCPDHDSKTNNMFVADGHTTANKKVWYQTVNVLPNTTYDLSAWGQAIYNANPAKLYFSINGIRVGEISTLAALDCAWQQFTAEWNSGSNTSVTLAIMNDNIDGSGNDFSLDDISMIPRVTSGCPKVGTMNVTMVTPTPATTGADTLAQCNNSTFNLIGNAAGVGETGRWELLSGLAIISNTASATTTASLFTGTTATVRWVIDKGGCSSTDTKTLINNSNTVGGTVSPATQTICASEGMFQTTPSVSGITGDVVRWEYQAPSSSTWTDWGGAGSTTAPANYCANTVGTWKVRAIIQNGVCASTASSTANIVVVADPSVSVSSTNTILCTGQSAVLTANVTGGSGTNSYQWQSSADNSTFNNISGATSATYNTGVLTNNQYYRVILTQTGTNCNTATSSSQLLTVVATPISNAGADQSHCNTSFTMAANTPSVGTGTWTVVSGTATIANANSPTTAVTLVSATATLRWTIAVNGTCSSSDDVNITFSQPITITTHPTNFTECIGGSQTLGMVFNGGAGTIAYQWQSSPNNSTWTNVSGANASTYTPPSTTVGTTYYRIIINASEISCSQAISNSASVAIVPNATVSINATNTPICSGGSSVLTANITNGTGTTTYQWQSSTDNTTFNNISGATSASYTTAALTTTTYFKVIVNQTGNGCGSITSATSIISVVSDPNVVVTASNSTVCPTNPVILTANITNGVGTNTHQWQSSTDSLTWTNISGATNNTYAPSTATAGNTYYRVILNQSGSGCNTANSFASIIRVINCSTTTCDNPLTPALNYNVFVKQGVTLGTGDSEGSVAMGGDLTLNGSFNLAMNSPGTYKTGSDIKESALVIGGKINYTAGSGVNVLSGGWVKLGNTTGSTIHTSLGNTRITAGAVGATPNVSLSTNQTPASVTGASGINFNTAFSTLQQNSTNLSALSNNITLSTTSGSTNITLANNAVNVLNLTGAQLNGYTQITFNNKPKANNPLIININAAGTFNWAMWNTAGIGDADGAYIIYNFYNTTALNLTNSITIHGSVLAPIADINKMGSANINGQIVGNSFTMSGGEMHYHLFDAPIDQLCCALLTVSVAANNSTICNGGTAILTATTANATKALAYQWQSSPNGTTWTNISGATSASYTTPALSTTTYYRMVVTQSGCSALNSSTSIVTVVADPSVSVSATNASVCSSGATTLNATVSNGTGTTTYQWQLSTDNVTFNNISGATNSNYTTPALTTTTYFKVIITQTGNGCGSVTSATTTVTVVSDLSATVTATNATICHGGTTILNSTINGGTGTPSYQWQSSTDNMTFSNITGATSTSYTTPILTANAYYKILVSTTGSGCGSATSSASMVTVVADPTVSVTTPNATICTGGTSVLTANVTNGTGTTTYQWQSSTDNITFNNISGATSATYTTAALTSTTYYKVIINQTGNGCSSTTSTSTTITVVADPSVSIAVRGGNSTICTGGNAILTASISNGTGTTTYQWQSSTDNITFNNILGETNPTLNTGALSATRYYKVVISQAGNGCGTATSTATTVTVVPSPTVSVSANNATICTGGNAILTASISNGTGTATYQWQSSTDNITFSNISGETNPTLNTGALTATKYYKVVISQAGNGCGTATSTATTVTVVPSPTISVSANNATICTGGNAILTASISNGTGTATYQWQSSTDNITFNNISGETNPTLNTGALSATRYYKVVISQAGNGCGSATSTATTVTVVPSPTVSVSANNATICTGGNAILTASISNGTGSVTYQWQSSTDNITFNNISGETNPTLNTGALSATRYYKVVISQAGNGCGTATSTATTVTVVPTPTVSVSANNATICTGGNAILTASISNGTGTTTYQWQASTDNITFNNISVETNPTLNTGALTATKYYKVVISQAGNGCGSATSTATTVTVVPSPNVSVSANNATICTGGNAILTASISNGTGTATYQWQSSTDNITFNNISGETNPTLNTGALSATRYYKVVITQAGNGCGTATSTATTVTVVPSPTVSVSANNASICTGGNAVLTASISNGTGSATYQWQSSTDNITFNNISGETNPTLNTGALSATRYYKVVISQAGNGCGTATSTATTVTVVPSPTVSVSTNNAIICTGGNAVLTASILNGTGTATYQWQSSTDNITFNNISGETNPTLNTGALSATRYYKVVISQAGDGCGAATSTATTVTVVPSPTVSVSTNNAIICTGGNAVLTASILNGTGTATYQWQSSTDNITFSNILNETNPTLNTGALSATMYYKVVISQAGNGCGTATSTATTVTVVTTPSVSVGVNNASICTGGNAVLTASISNGTGTATYQWQSSTDNITFNNISGETNPTLNTGALSATRYYKVVISQAGNGCGTANSTATTVTVVPAATVNVTASDLTLCTGSSAVLTANVTNGVGTATYQWQSSTDGVIYNNISGETGLSMTTPVLAATAYFRIVVTQSGNGCGAVTSATTALTVTNAPLANAGADLSQCLSNFTMAGNTPSVGTGTWTIVNGTATITNPNAPNTTVIVSSQTAILRWTIRVNAACEDFDDILLNLAEQLTINNSPLGFDECLGGNRMLGISTSGGTGFQNFQWQRSTDNATWADILNENNSNFTPPSTSVGTLYYRVVVTPVGLGCTPVTSGSARVRIFNDPTVTVVADDATICTGTGTKLSATVSDGTGTIAYQWQSSTDGVSFTNISGANNVIYNTPALNATTYYRLEITQSGSGCGPVTSTATTITVVPTPIAQAGADKNQCTHDFTMTAIAPTVGTGVWTVTNGTATIENPNSPTTKVTVTSTTATLRWTIDVNSTCSNGDNVVLTVVPSINITAQPTPVAECVGGTLPLVVTTEGGVGTFIYQWQSSTDNSTWSDISGANAATYTPSSTVAGTTYYHVIIRSTLGNCSQITSNSTAVDIIAKPIVKVTAASTTVCNGATGIQLNATVTGGVDCTIQWQNSSNGGAAWNDIPGEKGNTFSTSNLGQTTKYRVTLNCNGNGCCN